MDKPTSKAFIPILQVVDSALMEMQAGESKRELFLHYALELVHEMTLNGWRGLVDTEITMTPYKSIELPPDCIDWVVLGARVGAELLQFTNENMMVRDFKDRYDADLLDTDINYEKDNYGYFFSNLDERGNEVGQMFGLKVKHEYAGRFIEKVDTREIFFKSLVFTHQSVYVRYISSGPLEEDVTYVHQVDKPLIKAWVKYQYFLNHPSDRQHNRVGTWKEIYNEEYNNFIERTSRLSIADIKEVVYDSWATVPTP